MRRFPITVKKNGLTFEKNKGVSLPAKTEIIRPEYIIEFASAVCVLLKNGEHKNFYVHRNHKYKGADAADAWKTFCRRKTNDDCVRRFDLAMQDYVFRYVKTQRSDTDYLYDWNSPLDTLNNPYQTYGRNFPFCRPIQGQRWEEEDWQYQHRVATHQQRWLYPLAVYTGTGNRIKKGGQEVFSFKESDERYARREEKWEQAASMLRPEYRKHMRRFPVPVHCVKGKISRFRYEADPANLYQFLSANVVKQRTHFCESLKIKDEDAYEKYVRTGRGNFFTWELFHPFNDEISVPEFGFSEDFNIAQTDIDRVLVDEKLSVFPCNHGYYRYVDEVSRKLHKLKYSCTKLKYFADNLYKWTMESRMMKDERATLFAA